MPEKNDSTSETPRDAGTEAAPASAPETKRRRRWVRFLRFFGIGGLIFVAVAGAGLGGAEYYTATPKFCSSCHIMEPYYESWSHDKHGAKLDVRCVDCHYAPGERFTFKAKFKGLSQATSYFSGRAGGSRPRAHVSDEGCLTSGCHGDHEYLDELLPIGTVRMEERQLGGQSFNIKRTPTVTFNHAKHLDVGDRLEAVQLNIAATKAKIGKFAAVEAATRIDETAQSVGPRHIRTETMLALLDQVGLPELKDDALELTDLIHEKTRLQQLADINCAACHGYDETGGSHFRVDLNTCYTCHFTNETFNHGTGECLRCHEPPTRMIAVHDISLTNEDAPALMDHRDIVARGIDCASCHLDVVEGDSRVAARECQQCHDQDRYLVDFETRNTETVEEYHRVHVAGQRARCPDCHIPVQHRLIDPTEIGMSAGFLEPVLQDCQHCHPNHHAEQVELLMGTGGHGMERPMPNAMFGSRLNCRACHTQSGTDFKGAPLLEATRQTCIRCHGEDYGPLFEQWLSEIEHDIEEARSALDAVERRRKQLADVGKVHVAEDPRVLEMIQQARSNIHFVETGNGVHNKNLALHLLDLAIRDMDAAMALMSGR